VPLLIVEVVLHGRRIVGARDADGSVFDDRERRSLAS
jgi:hypothetical protein